jgi:hypothetical protein
MSLILYTTKLELFTNATVVDDAIRFVAGHQNQNQTKEEDRNENKKYNKHDNKDKVINEFETETLNSTDLNDLTSKQETSAATEATPTSNQVF